MSLLAVKSLSLTLGATLFTDLSFTLAPGDRLGLVAANGRGKSSLLRCLAGHMEPSGGDITRARGARVALVDQNAPDRLLPLTLRDAVADGLDPAAREWEEWRVDVVLDGLGVTADLRDRPMADLSGGWQRTALLARAAVSEPDLYLLDEPTNHLDLKRIAILTRWLADLPRATGVLIASHDRAFLTEATGRTLFLRPEASRLFPLPYGPARAELAKTDEADARAYDNRLKEADQLRRQAAKLKNIGINSGSDLLTLKTRQLTERAERIEDAARPAHKEAATGLIRLSHSASASRALVSFSDASIATPDGRRLFTTGTRWIERGDRVVILGANGSGKSRLIEAVRAAIATPDPAIRVAPTLSLGYAGQGLSEVEDGARPFDLIHALGPGDQQTRTLLAGAGILPDRQTGPVGRLSGGQKARLAMLILRLRQPNFYLLDEPTNHLDIEGQEALEAELTAEGATGLFVSHDRAFVRAVATRFWLIGRKTIEEVEDAEAFFAEMAAG